ncbi:MAG: S8 family serine peptidase [Verrucomicrobia bacterium]|nr:S8 family serine peptidase [Verrucomicrobiota bacterium]
MRFCTRWVIGLRWLIISGGVVCALGQGLPTDPLDRLEGSGQRPENVGSSLQPLAPRLVSESLAGVSQGGPFRLHLLGDPGKTYWIQASSNLVDWATIATNQTASDGLLEWTEAIGAATVPRFYRAVLSPQDAVPFMTDFFRPTRIVIKPKAGADVTGLHAALGARILRTFPEIGGLQVIHVAAGESVIDLILRYRESGLVEYAEPDYTLRLARAPNDIRFSDGSLWGLHNTGQAGGATDADIDAPEAWDLRTAADEIIVAVIDTGMRYTHEDLSANMWVNPGETGSTLIFLDKRVNRFDDDGNGYVDDVYGFNAITGSGDPADDHGHGTHVGGTIGAVGNNSVGVAGVAWRVRLMACKLFNARGEAVVSDAVSCLDYARRHGAKIINASWGAPTFQSSALRDAIESARRAGLLFITVAANNAGDNDLNPVYPANYELDNIIVVAATDRADRLAAFSNYGAKTVDLGAPGYAILSTWNTGDREYASLSGSSMSAAQVSGACALVWAHYPQETYLQIRNRILSSVDPLPSLAGKCVTGGRLNLHKALVGAPPSLGVKADFTAQPTSGPAPLTVQFTDKSTGQVSGWDWDFGDGSPHSNEPNPAHVYRAAGGFTATLTVRGSDASSSAKSQTISATPPVINYEIQAGAFNWIDPSGMTALSLGDDGVSAAIPLPFSFDFYGTAYLQIYVSANGLVGFSNNGLSASVNSDLPHAAVPNAILAPYWADLNPAQGGRVHVGTTGAAPDRRAVISWVDVPVKSSALFQTRMTFQAVLIEGANRVLFQYRQIEPNRLLGERQTGTVGIENESGARAAKFAYQENPSRLSNGQALLFIPQAASSSPPSGPCADDAGQEHDPNLKTLKPSELVVTVENNRKLLRFSNATANLGAGALEVFAKNNTSGTTEAFQRIFTLDGNCSWSPASTNFVGSFRFHPEHDHWHLEDFAKYELRNVAADGSMGTAVHATSGKVSFCLMDSVRMDGSLRHASNQTYAECNQSRPQGISVGWADVYQWYLPGQSLDITGLPNGDYWLVSVTDPSNLLDEGGGAAESDNTATLKLRIQDNRVWVVQQ